MKLYLGADHRGFVLKERLFAYLAKHGHEVIDVGNTVHNPSDDFPEYAQAAALKVLGDDNARAILICGSGQGMCMAANRFRGIRAALVWDAHGAQSSRRDNHSNVLCLSADLVADDTALWQGIVETWLHTAPSRQARYERRNQQMDQLG